MSFSHCDLYISGPNISLISVSKIQSFGVHWARFFYSFRCFFLCSNLSFPLSLRQARKDFITAKYTEKRFAHKKSPDTTSRLQTLCDAVKARDIFSLIQVYAEGVDLMEPIPLANGHVSLP